MSEGQLYLVGTATPRKREFELLISESAVKTIVHRLRQRFGGMLREAIAETVAEAHEVDDEVRHLLGVIAPWGPSRS